MNYIKKFFQFTDSIGYSPIVPTVEKFDMFGQPALIEQADGTIFPFNCGNHGGIL